MLPLYHHKITTKALSNYFGKQELNEVIKGNLLQDRPAGQFGHPEYHFDDSEFVRTYRYLDELRSSIEDKIITGDYISQARFEFGKLTHALQDFYAHTNYIRLWGNKHGVDPTNWDGEIDCQDRDIIQSNELMSGHFYSPWEMITFLPIIGRYFGKLFPNNSHAMINNNSPNKNPWFPMAFKCAELRTREEFVVFSDMSLRRHPENLNKFLGKPIFPVNGV